MTNFLLKEFDVPSSTEKYKSTDTMDPNFLSLAINGLPIVKTGSALDFGAVELANLANPTAAQSAVTRAFLFAQAYALDSAVIKKDGSVAFTGAQSMGSHKLTSLANGSAASDALAYGQAMLLDGSQAMTAALDFGSHKGLHLSAGTVSTDAVNYGQVMLLSGVNAMSAAMDMGSNQIHNLSDPTSAQDAATQAFVLAQIAASSSPLTNYFYIDPAGNDSTGNGSLAHPYATFTKAAAVIGSASSNADFNDASKRYYVVKASPGVYTESPSFGTRPFIILDLQGVNLVGTVTVAFAQGTISGANLQSPQFIIKGDNDRALAGAQASSGITGGLNIQSTVSGSSLVQNVQVIKTAISGTIHQSLGSGGGTFTTTLFIDSSIVGGITCDSGAGGMTLYAQHCDTSGSNAIGAVSGPIQIYQIHNVRFNGAVVVTGAQNGRWFDVNFASGPAHDFSGASGGPSLDANSYESFQANVPTLGSLTFTLLDTARGVGYTPAVGGNWSSVPAKVSAALDTLAADAQGYAKIDGSRAFTGDQSMGSHKITSLANGTNPNDAVNFSQLSAVAGGAVTLTQNHILVGNASNVSADVAMSGEASIVSSGAITLSNAAVIAKLLTGYAAGAGTVSASDSILAALQKIDGNDALKIPLSQKGANNGVATLDSGGKVPLSQLPASLMEYQGTWNATTNSPSLVDGTGISGQFYYVSVAGTQNLGSGSQTFVVGDWAFYNGSIWELAHAGADRVLSVNSQTGAVVLTTSNIAEGSNLYFTNLRAEDAVGGIVANSSKVSLTYVSGTSLTANIVAGSLVNADINGSAAIAYSKLALTGAILNADLAGSIAASKLVGTDIATVGTITAGTWHGSIVGALYGGTGTDSSGSTGIAHVAAGVWTYSAIVNADVSASAAIAYSKLALSNSIVNADINSAAAIAYSKLSLTGSIVNADVNASAAIAYSKLALSNSILNADINSAAAIAYSKLALSNSIVNADISTSAAIAYSKLALTNSLAAADMTTGVFDQSTIVGGNGTAASTRFYDSFVNDNAGAITVGQVVYIKPNGHVDLAAQATSNLSQGALGVVMDASIASGGTGKIIVRRGAVISGYSGMTPGAKEYVSTTAGALAESLTSTSGNYAYSVGRAESASVLIFDPQFEFQFA